MDNMYKPLTTIAFESSWWASSSSTAILAILWERTFWRVVQSAFLQTFLGISLKPKPRRNAPVTSPKVFEQAMANPKILPLLLIKESANWSYIIKQRRDGGAKKFMACIMSKRNTKLIWQKVSIYPSMTVNLW